MTTCLTCGAMVADNADVCPDCGMELSSASASSASAMAPAPTPPQVNNEGSGFTVDFGFESAAPASSQPASNLLSESANDDFSFGSGTLDLEKPTPATPVAPVSAPAPVAPSISARITLKRGGVATGESYVFGPNSIVGRFDPDSGPVEVDLGPLPESSYVSRHHVEFRHDAGSNSWFVKDLGSRNGTFWRSAGQGAFSRLSSEQALQSGDEIALGNARFEFHSL